jgi:hypothetical protein
LPEASGISAVFAFSGDLLLSFPPDMFANFIQLISGRPPAEHERGFVEEVRLVEHARPRNRRAEKLFVVCWMLIAVKCSLVIWLVDKYDMKFSPLWVNAPTVCFALLCTAVYYFRD